MCEMEQIFESSRVFRYSVLDLIELVKNRPIIWDNTRTDFRAMSGKEKAWREIYEALDDNYRSSDEKTKAKIGVRITAKWRNIRDAFMRSFKKRAVHSQVKKYMHHDQLTFMLKLVTTDDISQSPSRCLSTNSESTNENYPAGSTSCGYAAEDSLITAFKMEPIEETTTYHEVELCTAEFNIEDDDEKPKYFDLEIRNTKRKMINHANEYDELFEKVPRIEVEKKEQPAEVYDQDKEQLERILTSESGPSQADELTNTNIPPPSPDEDEQFFGSILSLVRDMCPDEKLEFRMAVLQLIHDTRHRRRIFASKN